MNIPDDVIENAGEAVYYKFGLHAGMNGAECERAAEIVLESAASALMAQAWDEGCKAGNTPFKEPNPYKPSGA